MAKHSDGLVRLIGAFKLTKATLLLGLGVAGLVQSPGELGRPAGSALAWMGIFPGGETLTHGLQRLLSLSRGTEQKLAVLLLLYAAVFAGEGVGLLRRKRWAEWMTVVVTASFIPLEAYELVEHAGAGKIVALVLNVAIVIYLLWRRLEERRSIGGRGRMVQSRIREALRLT